MNRRNIFTALTTFITCIIFFSCSDSYEEAPKASLDGEWTTYQRIIETNDPETDNRINTLFIDDGNTYKLKRIFTINVNYPNQGTIETIAENTETGLNARKTESSFVLDSENITISDPAQGQLPGTYFITGKRLETQSQISYQAVMAIITELGGDVTIPVRNDIEGTLTIIDFKK